MKKKEIVNHAYEHAATVKAKAGMIALCGHVKIGNRGFVPKAHTCTPCAQAVLKRLLDLEKARP